MNILDFKKCIAPDKLSLERIYNFHPFVRQSDDGIRRPWHLKNRKLLDYLAVFINSGHGIFTLEGKSYEMGSGDLFWVPPDTMHEMRSTSKAMHCLYAHFDLIYNPRRSHWNAYIHGGTDDLSQYNHLMHPPIDDSIISQWNGKLPLKREKVEILAIFKKIVFEHKRSPSHGIKLSGLVLELIETIQKGLEPVQYGLPRHLNKMNNIAEYILLNFCEPDLEIREIAKKFALSETHFRKLFKETFGVCPSAMLQNARLRYARELLCYTHMSISEIAEATGYKNIYDFSRTFHKCSGCSPSRFRK